MKIADLVRRPKRRPASDRARWLFGVYVDTYNRERSRLGLGPISGAPDAGFESFIDGYAEFLEWIVEDMWSDAERGFKVLRSASKAQGTPEQKAERWGKYQAVIDDLRFRHPMKSKNWVRQQAAKALKVNAKTLQRRTRDAGPAKNS